jgi:hypothetical protein
MECICILSKVSSPMESKPLSMSEKQRPETGLWRIAVYSDVVVAKDVSPLTGLIPKSIMSQGLRPRLCCSALSALGLSIVPLYYAGLNKR